MNDHNKKLTHYLIKGEIKLVFNNNQDCKYVMTGVIDNRTFVSWSDYVRDAIHILKDRGYDFNHKTEKKIITIAHNRDVTYGFYLKHNMPAFEWKLNQIFNKNKT